jgi:hypothetical protein
MLDLKKNLITPICHTHPIRAELELNWYGRQMFEEKWDDTRPGVLPVVSLPHQDFIDGFGVYRNSYRSLMGFYSILAGLSESERKRPGSIFPIVLGPHASDFGDVIKALRTMEHLDEGMEMEVNGKMVRLCAYTMCYIGDMPQMAENSGLKGPRAKKFCRCCYTFSGQKAVDPEIILKVDLLKHGRFHTQMEEMQHYMATLSDVNAKRYGTQWGMVNSNPPLVSLSPALDLVLSRPLDPAHSEYNGLGNLMHFLLRDGILTKAAQMEYGMELRAWPFPPGARPLMSTVHHLASYKMSHHALWIVVVPAFLLSWLKKSHIKKSFYDKALAETGKDPVDLLVETTAAIAKSTTLLMGRKMSGEDRQGMYDIIYRARVLFNQLCIFAANTSLARSTAPSQAGSRAGSRAGSVVLQGAESVAEAGDDGVCSNLQYINDTLRPNIHVGIHYPAFAEEYALPVNCNTLTGENLHR